ncbi:putative aldouronate transport system permease protein [Paenibacillus rhizosphaerae]|uniref:Putative aldouronate transport system permease protein n=1 Tax=Paenibacillus rhizosphaerae TaxID=297318 RepID=A0A839TFN2_9BACL|nr:carbohydrate ABC transporter permease [Paenibacillus rhizosphaerae]MBB3125354.1 putative aldouronate transport system permease protein [Paenibacillus rhizosphaerae]
MKQLSMGDRLFTFFAYTFLVLFTALILLPLLYIIITSFAPAKDYLTRGFFLIPSHWTLDAYQYLLHNPGFVQSFKNSIFITVIGTFINITVTSMMAYGLSESWIKGRSAVNFMILFTMLFSGGLVPTYLVVDSLHLIDTFWALWLPAAVAPFNVIVMRSFFASLPYELKESSRIDGCGEWRMFAKIILPLAKPAIATFTLFYMVGNWNTYFSAVIYLNDDSKWPLQVFLRQMLVINDERVGLLNEALYTYTPSARMAAILVSALPLLVIYPFLQKHFNKGMLVGSVKG